MVAVKAHQATAFLKSPDPRLTAFLLYGTDQGLVAERAAALAKAMAARENPPGEVIRLDDLDFDNDPDRLSVELLTLPMFGGRKIVRVATGRKVNTLSLKPLVEDKGLAGTLIVEAGNLRPDEGLRTLFEKATQAAAIACYTDEAGDIEAVIREVLEARKLTIAPGARQMLVSRLGADRALSRGEIEKLALYADGAGTITEEDVEAIVGDAAELTIDRITQAAALGDAARAVNELSRALAAGESAQGVIAALQRHFQRLHRLRSAVESGKSVEAAIGELRPPLHFKQKDAIAAQCRAWRLETLDPALAGIATAARTARTSAALEDSLAERLILSLARLARAGR